MIADAEQWGEGSHADRLERIIARAKQADRLEAQLARECEKRQALELKLKRLEQAQGEQRLRPSQRPRLRLSRLCLLMSLAGLIGAMFLMLS